MAFDIVAEKTGRILQAFEEAMENVMPVLEVRLQNGWCNLSGTGRVRPERRQTLD